ncbi:MAG TPA: glycosyltransferase family 39 protein, partial [Candidatus Limnocylindria bacterium]|nr:glycosyltransferase family 39 protein [Candidatus Limnocylindria bacterium]
MTKHRAPKPPRRAAAPRAPWFTLHAPTLLSDAETRLDTRLAWVFAALLAIALFLVATGPHVVGDAFTETDFYGAYAEGARLLQQGQIDPTRYRVVGPGYEAALALFGLPFRDLLLAAEMLSLVSMVAGWLLWVVLLKRRTDARLALIAGAFIALNPTFFRYGYSATTDALAFALQALALFLLLARSGLASAALAGVVAALAFLTRYNAVYLLPAGLVALWLGGTLQERRGRAALLFAAGFVAPVVPWVLFSLARGGALGLELHHNIAYDVFARSRKIPWDEYQEKMQPQFKTLWDVIAKDPAAVIKRELFNVWDHLRLDAEKLLRWPVAAAALIGIGFAWVDGTLRRTWPVVLAGALLFLTLVPVFHSERYSLPLVPIYALLAAATFASRRWALAIGRSRRLWLKAVVAVVVLALSLFASVRYQVRSLQPLPIEVLEVSRTLRALKGPSDRLLARKPHIAFHGQIKMVPFPFTKNLP